ncbi:hypothetical protein ABL78_3440 [Leptomonas seymouri]|uniref:3'-5' exonuclease n=1 Tax=Leptomonas seymouri TaxID=5684 RepID=A0A0N1PBV0_LEPSE|nr:hypothetical protein ABL78_3440 [Leptomonas seymouri]|eukprot:KPI87491.1 hypothetical protein ABL78_3440 [Leptomonas seymouri]
MQTISSFVVSSRMRGVFVNSTDAWNAYGEKEWREMIAQLDRQPAHLRIMGLDAEWFNSSPLSVVQLATASHCFVLHLCYFTERHLPGPVKEALSDPSIIKCGVGVCDDGLRLSREQGCCVQSLLDVAHYCVALGLHSARQSNLKLLAASVADLHIEKSKKIVRSNWEKPLTRMQVNYAAEDALASFLIGDQVMRKAYEVYNMGEPNFSIPEWLRKSACFAAQTFKQMQREYAIQGKYGMKEGACVASTDHGSMVRAAQLGNGARVAVIDKAGRFLFECSQGRAKFYVMQTDLARITKCANNNPHKALQIQLLFDTRVKTRLCLYNLLGVCELQDQCPFAHGIDKLQPDARALLTSSEPSCACCLGTKGLLRHAITPPSFRKYLPPPFNCPQDDDFKPLCGQCRSILVSFFDAEMKKCYSEAMSANKSLANISVVSKCVSYSRMLTNEKSLSGIPEGRQEELKGYIRKNWEKTCFRDFNPDFVIGKPLELSGEFLMRLARIVPGDVQSMTTVNTLVGKDLEKAKAFTQRWRDYCFQVCGMIEKESNNMSRADWELYCARNDR